MGKETVRFSLPVAAAPQWSPAAPGAAGLVAAAYTSAASTAVAAVARCREFAWILDSNPKKKWLPPPIDAIACN